MYAMFALAGDVGCSTGPALVGFVTGSGRSMQNGILTAIVFPVILFLVMLFLQERKTYRYPD